MSHQPLPLHGNTAGELPPPLVMRHLERHSKDPLPSITPTRSSRGASPPEVAEEDSPTVTKANLDESPTALVGSLAAARRRARHANQSQPHASVSPANVGSGPSSPTQMQLESLAEAEDKLESGGRVKAGHKTCAALLDVLDPDADGSMIVDVLQPPRPAPEHSQRPPAGSSVVSGGRAPRPTY